MQIRTSLADFPSVFELRTPDSYPTELGAALTGLLHDPKSEASLNQALNAEFTYLEPGFTESEDFAWTERRIWRQLRLLRVMFDETYWAALRSHGIAKAFGRRIELHGKPSATAARSGGSLPR
jgi:hypothetical protein